MRRLAIHVNGAALAMGALLVLAACGGDPEPDAYGTFEAVEVVVSSQASGQVHEFTPAEGMQLPLGTVVAVIDTAQLALERQQILAQRNASSSRSAEVTEQLRVLDVQREIAQRAYERTRRLHAERAATTQQLDQTERDYRTLTAQLRAVRAQRESVGMDVTANDARVDQIADRIAKSIVRNPQAGTVLTTYTRTGEVVQTGQPLYKVADLETLVLRAYVTGAQLASVRLGQQAQVRVDRGHDELLTLAGTVTWISPTAEFTPTPIQTREERADLVYAVKVQVGNADGVLKIGMPADVTFAEAQP
ncbi:MAG: HlyD family secretion protein [Longimicrobiales bacterium]